MFNSHRVAKAGISQCLEGTRVEVLERIVAWFTDDSPKSPRVFWLNGMAGHGKSTIAKTIAHKARAANRLGGSFFASRRASIRLRDPAAIIPTIAYQLAEFSNDHLRAIANAAERHRHATDLDILEQADILLRGPLASLKGPFVPPVVIFDAWDELDSIDGRKLLQILLSNLSGESALPLKVFFTSRPETYIQRAFQDFESSADLFLHKIEEITVKKDIELYLNTRLREIPRELDLLLPQDWFSPEEFTALVRSSGNLFVYSATVVRFLSSEPPSNPPSQLKKVLAKSDRPTAALSYLDELYLEILAEVAKGESDFLQVFRVLIGSMILLRDSLSVMALEKLLGFEKYQSRSTLKSVFSLIIFPVDPSGVIQFYHPCVPEFFVDLKRCHDVKLYVDPAIYEMKLAERCLRTIRDSTPADAVSEGIRSELYYSCTYWASHLSKAPAGDHHLLQSLDSFVRLDFLRWLEIVSIKRLLYHATRALLEAEIWAVCISFIALTRHKYLFYPIVQVRMLRGSSLSIERLSTFRISVRGVNQRRNRVHIPFSTSILPTKI